jgi:pyruvate formate lyase activating enzyme
MNIKGFVGTSLLDYPKKISAIIFLAGCDLQCPYCHNPDLIGSAEHIPDIPLDHVLQELKNRKGFLDGVVISGGEPTIHKKLENLIKPIKKLGYPVKIDTNGNNPDLLKELIENKLVDYIAMDVKSSVNGYNLACGIDVEVSKIKRSIDLIINKAPDYELRTTVVPSLIKERDIINIAEICKGAKIFYINQFRSFITYDEKYEQERPYNKEVLYKFKEILDKTIGKVEIRGI